VTTAISTRMKPISMNASVYGGVYRKRRMAGHQRSSISGCG
jgi:hypothetical protein